MYLTCFNDTGMRIIGMPASDLIAMKDDGDERRLMDTIQEGNCKTYVFRCLAKMDNYGDAGPRYVYREFWSVKR